MNGDQMSVSQESAAKASIRNAWNLLLTRIVLEMKLGYYQELVHKQQHAMHSN